MELNLGNAERLFSDAAGPTGHHWGTGCEQRALEADIRMRCLCAAIDNAFRRTAEGRRTVLLHSYRTAPCNSLSDDWLARM